MIRANELRVGNLVWSDIYKRKFRVKAIYKNAIEQDDSDYTTHLNLENIQPISLTPEILEKAGFIYHEHFIYPDRSVGHVFKNNIHFITAYYTGEGYGLSWILAGSQSCCGKQILYLHDLQNMYFSLTGTELTINF